ncbi:hypothetical protein MOB49_01940 [Bacillus haynesii]|uniref:hypothetical protein n=1 Tax=Bacillus haynesii TaxID=1925021 RepID=UPI0015F3FB47|nr:hypothetical protein [Bacillus haynesii]MCY7835522.1 hypothetical protein [Bacillus haynesii]MCY7965839.1 hypothetical protein [Bacillus haynesii]MCY7993563.1 hypothetical protein [Bacillus haynesii]MCY8092301.1 hypothetical protein [Bacillus haynesii]MCY8142457.1 hypothetical protein [Bacillus haynesii]
MGIEKNVPVLSCAAFFRLQSGPLHINKVLIAYQRKMGFSIKKRDVSNDDRPDQDQVLLTKGDEYDFKNAGAAVLRGDFHIGQNERG